MISLPMLRSGQKVAIVGPTGAGKTTMVNLLMRFYDLDGGDIRIDGISTKDMSREEVHGLFGMVLQDTWMFEGTVRENLVYNRTGVSDETLERACRACGIYHFIETLPHGLRHGSQRKRRHFCRTEAAVHHCPRHGAEQPDAHPR